MRPGVVHHLMSLILYGGMLAFIAYICGESVVAGILAALLFSIFRVLLVREIVLKLTGRRE